MGTDREPDREHRVAVSAHRGGTERAPAATLAAFHDAVAAGVDYVEFDVRRTRDGELVVFHDPLTGDRDRGDLGGVPDPAEVLAMIAGRTRAHVDIKAPGFEAEVVALAIDLVGVDGFMVTGADDVVAAVKRDHPDVRAALSLGRGWGEVAISRLIRTRWSELHPLRRVRACGADAVAVHHRLARLGVLADCARHGIGAMVWTVNDAAMIRGFLADDRVDVLITDRPRYALQVRDAGPGRVSGRRPA